MLGIKIGEQAERSRFFEATRESTASILQDPGVSSALDVIGVDLNLINEEAILPNVKRGKVDLPKGSLDSNGVVVLPLTEEEIVRGVVFSERMFAPTPRRHAMLEKQIEQLEDEGRTVDIEALISFFQKDLMMNSPGITLPLQEDDNTLGYHRAAIVAPRREVLYSSRPVVIVRQSIDPKEDPLVLPHEYVHADDTEMLERLPDDLLRFRAYLELRAYFVTEAMVGAIGRDSTTVAETSDKVNRLRKLFGMKVPPLHPDDLIPKSLIAEMHKAGFIGDAELSKI